MDRARAADPYSNKLLYRKDLERRQRMHRANLRKMKPAIDNKPPKKPSHLANNKKREQMIEEQFIKIERENRLLLEKMSHIMSKPKEFGTTHNYKLKSLNKSYRKRELHRITLENQSILRRIQERQPYYNHTKWEEDRKTNEAFIKNISEYPVNRKKKGRRMNKSRSGIIPPLDSEYQRQSHAQLNSFLHGG